MGLEPACAPASMRASISAFTRSNMNIAETSWPINFKIHLEYYRDRGLAALCFGPDRIRTLVSMATDSSHRVILGIIIL